MASGEDDEKRPSVMDRIKAFEVKGAAPGKGYQKRPVVSMGTGREKMASRRDTEPYSPTRDPVQAEHNRVEMFYERNYAWTGKTSIEKPLQAEHFKDIVPRTCLENELRLVLVGKTGVGKSETANTIAGHELFISNASASSVTRTCKQKTFQRDGQNLQLIDVPGFVDTHMTPELIKEEVVKCVALSHPGLHAILFVVEIGRFTNDDINTIEEFCNCFGKEALEFVIVIFTKLDSLMRKGNTLQGFIDGAPGPLKDLLAKTNYRYLGVNNWSDDKTEKESFVTQLLHMVRSLVKANGDKCFTNEMYELAEQKLRENIEKEKRRLAKVERKKEEKILREANEKFRRELEKQEREKMELEKKMKARQEELERKVEMERKRDEEKLKQEREEYQQKIENEKNDRLAMEREMKAREEELERIAEEERKKAEEEHQQKLEKEKNDRLAIERQMKAHKEKMEQLEKEKRDKEEKMRLEMEEDLRKLREKQEREKEEMEKKMKVQENEMEEKRIKMEEERRKHEDEKKEAEKKLQQEKEETEREMKLREMKIKEDFEKKRDKQAVENTREDIESSGFGEMIQFVGKKVVEHAGTIVGGLKKVGGWIISKLW